VAAYMPTGPGSSGWADDGQALAGSSQVPGRRSSTPSMSTSRTGRCWWAPKRMAATWPISQTSPQAAKSNAATSSQLTDQAVAEADLVALLTPHSA
jgi:hypothetical protein